MASSMRAPGQPADGTLEIHSALAAWLQEGTSNVAEERLQQQGPTVWRHPLQARPARGGAAQARWVPHPAEALGQGGAHPRRLMKPADADPGVFAPPSFELNAGLADTCGDCPICLEKLQAGKLCCRAPCLHVFHEACLADWLRCNSSCPVCKLNLAAPCRQLRYRLKELEGLTARELRYMATYLGIEVQRGAERPELEMKVFSNPHVRVLCHREELHRLSVQRLRVLLQSAGIDAQVAGLSEKGDLVEALLASGHCVEDSAPTLETPTAGVPGNAAITSRVAASRSAPY